MCAAAATELLGSRRRDAASPPSFRRTWQKSMTRCQTDRMHNDGSSRQHGRQQRAWPGHGHKTRKGRPLAGWAGAWSSLAFFADPSTAFFFRRRSHDSEFCVVSVGRRRELKRRAATSPTAAWRQRVRGQCTRPCTAVERNRVSNKLRFAVVEFAVFCTVRPMQTASLAGPGGLTGLTGPQPYVSPSLRAFQIAVLLQIAQSQFVSVESHSSVFFRLLYVVNMVSKTCFLINVVK